MKHRCLDYAEKNLLSNVLQLASAIVITKVSRKKHGLTGGFFTTRIPMKDAIVGTVIATIATVAITEAVDLVGGELKARKREEIATLYGPSPDPFAPYVSVD